MLEVVSAWWPATVWTARHEHGVNSEVTIDGAHHGCRESEAEEKRNDTPLQFSKEDPKR